MTYEEKKQWLNRYRKAQRQQQVLQEELAQLRSSSCRVTQLLSAVPGGAGDGQALPRAVEQILHTQQQLAQQIALCQAVRRQVASAIDQLPAGSTEHLLLRRRYLMGQCWCDIAREMQVDERWLYRKHKLAVQKLSLQP